MLVTLSAVFLIYLLFAYAFGLYLALRTLMGRRLRHLIAGASPRRLIRPLSGRHGWPGPHRPAPAQALGIARPLAA